MPPEKVVFVDRFLSKREEFQRPFTISLESHLNHPLKSVTMKRALHSIPGIVEGNFSEPQIRALAREMHRPIP